MPTGVSGQWNLAALQVPGIYIDIIPPSPLLVGVPTNGVGIVGVGSWGPTNAIIPVSTPNDCAIKLGVPINRTYDIASHVWASSQVGGAIAYSLVRVTDGTDAAASVVVQSNCITLTAKYTGVIGNNITATIATGTKSGTYAISILMQNAAPEVFNNISGSGNAFWVNVAAAINSGNSTRGPSSFVVATAGAGTAAPTTGSTITLSGGTDGASGVTDSTLMGQDIVPRKGMYVLRNAGTQAFALVDMATSANWPAMDSFAISENTLSCVATVSGDSIANAVASRTSAGLDDMWTWLAVGDWPTFYDSWNGTSRLVNPTAFMLGIIGNQSPEQSPLNKVLRGISATQTTQANKAYSYADLQIANMGGVDLIIGPPSTPGGNYYSFATGRNASSNTAANGVEYTTLTNFLARSAETFAAGSIVGQLQSTRPNDQTRAKAKALFDGFSAQLADPQSGSGGNGIIDSASVQCDLTNNPPDLQARGYLFLYWTVRYLNVVRYFVVKLAGGGNVQVTVQSTPPSPTQFT